MLGAESVHATHPDAAAHQIMAAIFGGGSTSRFVKEVTIRQHLSHSAGGFVWQMRHHGNFMIGASVQPEDAKKVIGIAYDELRKLANNVTQAELDKIKSQFETSLMRQMETSHGSCSNAGVSTLVHGRPLTPAEALARIQAVTLDDIKRVAKEVLQSNPMASFVVPPGTDKSLLPTHAEVVAMRDGSGGQNKLTLTPSSLQP
jgi:predicted Zn-dependent peptidase